ncbi:DUF1016 N-terminal domain-containing protein [Bradyrhizobium erythrophlei]
MDRLAEDLQKEFPGAKGFSARNLRYVRDFAAAYGSAAVGKVGPLMGAK